MSRFVTLNLSIRGQEKEVCLNIDQIVSMEEFAIDHPVHPSKEVYIRMAIPDYSTHPPKPYIYVYKGDLKTLRSILGI